MSKVQRKRKYRRRFSPSFENGGFWEYYMDLERQFEDFLDYVPYIDRNENVCSFRLVNLLYSIGGHVDSAFKEMAFYSGFSRSDKAKCRRIRQKVKETRRRLKAGLSPGEMVRIDESLAAFEDIYGLSERTVTFKRLPEREEITPFTAHNPRTNAPRWWEIYNGNKHDFSKNFDFANLLTIRDALAGAFLLNVIHKPAILRLYDYDLIETLGETVRPQLEDIIRKNQKLFGIIETEFFIYDYEQGGEKAE